MDDFNDPDDAVSVCRLFPLSGVVLFPHIVLPLHIFEPRYRQMTEHALSGDGRIAMVQYAPAGKTGGLGDPAIEPMACLGEILKHERLPDGRFNILLIGRERIHLMEELPQTTLYRRAAYELVEEIEPVGEICGTRDRLVRIFREFSACRGPIDAELDRLLDSTVSLGILTDILAHALSLDGCLKQAFLAQPDAERRAAGLIEVVEQIVPRRKPPFPPEFSCN